MTKSQIQFRYKIIKKILKNLIIYVKLFKISIVVLNISQIGIFLRRVNCDKMKRPVLNIYTIN